MDGFHRVAAAELAKLTEIAADVAEGTRDEAVWASIAANKAHGLKRTDDDKRKAVWTALELRGDRPEEWSNRKLADHAGVSEGMVRDHRAVWDKKKAEDDSGCPTAYGTQSDTQKRVGKDGVSRPAEQVNYESLVCGYLDDNPDASVRDIAAALEIGRGTVGKWRKLWLERQAAGDNGSSDTDDDPSDADTSDSDAGDMSSAVADGDGNPIPERLRPAFAAVPQWDEFKRAVVVARKLLREFDSPSERYSVADLPDYLEPVSVSGEIDRGAGGRFRDELVTHMFGDHVCTRGTAEAVRRQVAAAAEAMDAVAGLLAPPALEAAEGGAA